MLQIIDRDLSLDLFLKNKNFAFSFDKNNEVDSLELTRFFNEHFFSDCPFTLTEENLKEAIRLNQFSNMKAQILESKVVIEELRGLGHDWVVVETTVQMERQILEALGGGWLLTGRIQRQRSRQCRVRNLQKLSQDLF